MELASGKSNREIAEALFITQNTVIRHVANIFSKTGSANRVEATAYALRQELQ
jgi:DNA-binding NarL/FixJ family response regulator